MLGSDRFAFETPNIIDPGDLPPSQPTHVQSTTVSTAASSEEECDYQEARESANRLLNDINDLELSPVKPTLPRSSRLPFRDFPKQKPYYPYEQANDDHHHAHSLPSSEEARMHAASLLAEKRGRSIPLPPRKQRGMVRHQVIYQTKRSCMVLAIIALVVGTILGIGSAVLRRGGGSSPVSLTNGRNRYHAVVEYLAAAGVSEEALLRQSGTPQNLAANWLATTDRLQYEVPPVDQHVPPTTVHLVQRYVLAVLYFGTGGAASWKDSLGFTTDQDECSWNHPVQTPGYVSQQIAVGVSCDSNLRVTTLFIPENGLVGPLPTELQYLTELTLVNFQDNLLSGPLAPSVFAGQQHLLYLNLNNNTFTGPIPEDLGYLAGLEMLGLALNDFEGTVPYALGNLLHLKSLAVSFNPKLSGSLDFTASLANLAYFYAGSCSFSGLIEEPFFANLGQLRELDLSHNDLSGVIPLDMLLHEYNLAVIDLADNEFSGGFPDVIDRNIVLNYLNLRDNKMSGTIPMTINSLEELNHLDLQGNLLEGFIPNTLGRMVNLNYLFIGNNPLQSLVPPLNQLERLKVLSLQGLGLTGNIPEWLVYMGSLELLDLSKNSLEGTIPSMVWNLPLLYILFLDNNKLQGPIPEGGGTLEVFTFHANSVDAAAGEPFATVCEVPDRPILADCHAGCTCCEVCCDADGDCGGADRELEQAFLGGVDYTMSNLSFDPDILDESGLFGTFDAEALKPQSQGDTMAMYTGTPPP